MQCLKCGRKVSIKKKICLYCGASFEETASRPTTRVMSEDGHIFISEEQKDNAKLKDFPEHIRHRVEDAIRSGAGEVTIEEESTEKQFPMAGSQVKHQVLSLEKILNLLSKMKDSFKNGLLSQDIYERMVVDIIKDYISTLDDHIKIDFVVNEIPASELTDYINEKMLNDLRAFTISSVSGKESL